MTAPERIWAWPSTDAGWAFGMCSDTIVGPLTSAEYILHTRAALATPAHDAVQEAGADYAAGFAEGIRRAAELPAYDCDGDPCGAFDNPIFVKRDAILALTPSSQEARHDRT